jgi:hypothetical protein
MGIVDGIVDQVLTPIESIINKVIPDKSAAAAAVAALNQLNAQGQLAEELQQLKAVTSDQSAVDTAEATNKSIWVSGWRPLIGWVCGSVLAEQYIIQPLIIMAHGPFQGLPQIDTTLWTLLFGMLGLGSGLRTIEKVKGVAST